MNTLRLFFQFYVLRTLGFFLSCFVSTASLYNLVNKAKFVRDFSLYVYFFSLHVSRDYVPIIMRYNCIYMTLCTCHSVWVTGMQEHMLLHTRHSSTIWSCIPDSNPYRITSNKCRINTVVSPDDGHIVARNM